MSFLYWKCGVDTRLTKDKRRKLTVTFFFAQRNGRYCFPYLMFRRKVVVSDVVLHSSMLEPEKCPFEANFWWSSMLDARIFIFEYARARSMLDFFILDATLGTNVPTFLKTFQSHISSFINIGIVLRVLKLTDSIITSVDW